VIGRSLHGGLVLIAALAGLAAAVAAGPAASGPPQPSASFAQFVDAHCLDCHDGVRAKGGFDLAGIMPAGEAAQRDAADAWMTAADPTLPRAMRARLARQDMPPANIDERPSDAEYAAMIAAIDVVVPPESREVPVVHREDVPCSHDPRDRRRRIHRQQLRPFVV